MKTNSHFSFPTAALVDIAEWPQTGKPYDALRMNAPILLAKGFRTNIVIFAGEAGPVWGIAVFPADQPHPKREQVQRIYDSLGSPLPPVSTDLIPIENQIIAHLGSLQ